MRRARSHRAASVGLLLAFFVTPTPARADMGPVFERPRITIRISRQGQPVSEAVVLLLLKPQLAGDSKADPWEDIESNSLWVKDIDRTALADEDGSRWVPPQRWAAYCLVPDAGPGIVTFYFRPDREPVPPRVRVALYLADENQVVVTNAVQTRPYITELTLDLQPDDTASLVATSGRPMMRVLGVLRENITSLLLAVVVTIVLELLVIGACAWFRKGSPVRRLFGTVVLGNLVTVPLVWFVSVYGKVELESSWPVPFLFAELAATAFEGWLYYRIGRIPLPTALLWSALANWVTLLVGCCLVAFTV
jgi:hypothetical protein